MEVIGIRSICRVGVVVLFAGSLGCLSEVPSDPTISLDEGTCAPKASTQVELAQGIVAATCSSAPSGAQTAYARPAYPPGVLYSDVAEAPLPDRVAYLTFDDGPSEWTLEILETLRAKGVKATFFINARNLKGVHGLQGNYFDSKHNRIAFKDVLAAVVRDGHDIGNHTVDHDDFASLSAEELAETLDENERMVNVALREAGQPTRLLSLARPPYGSPWFRGPFSPDDVEASRTSVGNQLWRRAVNVLWNLDSTDSAEWAIGESFTLDTKKSPTNSSITYEQKKERILNSILQHPLVAQKRGINILMHDTHNATRDVVGEVIDRLRAAGYSFALVEDYIRSTYGRPSWELTPGPGLYDACVAQSDRGCIRPSPNGPALCGRVLESYLAAGGASVLGAPVEAPRERLGSRALSMEFEHGTLALHPEVEAPCDVAVVTK